MGLSIVLFLFSPFYVHSLIRLDSGAVFWRYAMYYSCIPGGGGGGGGDALGMLPMRFTHTVIGIYASVPIWFV